MPILFLAAVAAWVASSANQASLQPIPHDATGAKILLSVAEELGMMTRERMEARSRDPRELGRDAAVLRAALAQRGYDVRPDQVERGHQARSEFPDVMRDSGSGPAKVRRAAD